MSTQPQTDESTVVRKSLDVSAPPQLAFDVFTAGINSWWTREHHVLGGELADIGIEPQVGGRLWQVNDAGATCDWGRVVSWEPPREFTFLWFVGPDWGIPKPGAPGSRVTVTFTPTDDGTHIDLVHDRLDVHGEGWQIVRDGVAGPEGWPLSLGRYAEVLAGRAG